MAESYFTNGLRQAVLTSEEEKDRLPFQPLPVNLPPEQLFQSFAETPQFTRIMEEARCHPFRDAILDTPEEAYQSYHGRTFMDLATTLAYSDLRILGPEFVASSSATLISPQATLDFYRHLYPSAPLRDNLLGLGSLEGISVPDGLIVVEIDGIPRIVRVCEYTLRAHEGYYVRKLHGFRINGEVHEGGFAQATCLFVIPNISTNERSETGHHITVKGKKAKDASLRSMPFRHGPFNDYFDQIWDGLVAERQRLVYAASYPLNFTTR